MSRKIHLLKLLCNGNFHSGAELGKVLNASRSAVWRDMQSLIQLGLEVQAVPGKGYRLASPIEFLNRDSILAAMDTSAKRLLSGLELLEDIDSTNLYLLRKAAMGTRHGCACLAERQRKGRGRHGRCWVSPFACNIYLSLLWRFAAGPTALDGLSLAVGVGVVRALKASGVQDVGLKWPNDVLWQGRKLAGILLDTKGEAGGPCQVVAGVGLNVSMSARLGAVIDQPWVDVQGILGHPARRNQLAGILLQHLLLALHEFEASGLSSFLEEWATLDLLAGKPVLLRLPQGTVAGLAQGIDADGALRLSVNEVTRRYRCGEVSLRQLS